ncbi:ATP-binding cassette domain-containing protein [Oceanivirga salmonicida]|uniref:ATP-binding cassette domain-containing protein n=1 Tax=Oceanivirga salmonicida TaxID=1769291 RepID=UPI00082F4777|nr:ABC transporter ATP-binding protein [Oceanivirga salmonicida]
MVKELEIKKLNVHIDGEHLLKNIDMEVYENEVVGILGESGSGKTLTVKYILGILPERSEIKVEKFKLNDKVGVVFQNAFTLLNPTVKIGKQLKHLYYSHYKTYNGFEKRIQNLFDKVGLFDTKKYLDKYTFEASGGENQRIAIAAALVSDPEIFIADEITTALDTESKLEVINLLKKIKENKKSIIFITHEINLMKKFVDRIYVMYKGEIIESDTTDNIFTNPKHPYTRKLIELENKYYSEIDE